MVDGEWTALVGVDEKTRQETHALSGVSGGEDQRGGVSLQDLAVLPRPEAPTLEGGCLCTCPSPGRGKAPTRHACQ